MDKGSKVIAKKRSVMKIVVACICVGILLVLLMTFFQKYQLNTSVDASTLSTQYEDMISKQNIMKTYSQLYVDYQTQKLLVSQVNDTFKDNLLEGYAINQAEPNYGKLISSYVDNVSSVYVVDENHSVSWTNTHEEESLYQIEIDYYEIDQTIDETQFSLTINGESPFYESQSLIMPSSWVFESSEFKVDRYQNDIQPTSNKRMKWKTMVVKDYKGIHPDPYRFHFKKDDKISISYVNSRILIAAVRYVVIDPISTYESYLAIHPAELIQDELITISARDIYERNDPSIRLRTEQNPSNVYYDTQFLKLNTIFGDSWRTGGQSITYEVQVSNDGLYQLSFNYRQYLLKDLPVFRSIYINGEIPYEELQSYAFPYTLSFVNRTVQDEAGKPYYVYLKSGTNTITLEAVAYPYRNSIETLKYIMDEIQQLSLQIKKYTSGSNDRYRDWDIELYFPLAKSDILSWAALLNAEYDRLKTLTDHASPSEISNMLIAVKRLEDMADSINTLPSKMVQFSDGDSSVNYMLGRIAEQLMRPSLELEKTMIHGDTSLPKPYVNIFFRMYEETKRFILSFINNPYSIKNNVEELNVWVNYPRQHIEIMQNLIDQSYKGNRKVTLSQMPDQNKLILANTSGQSPDVAIGVDHWIPYEFAIRGAALDLRQLKGYEQVVKIYSKGAMIPYVFEEGVYGIPCTQNFWVTYYRKDILNSIGMTTIPSTWGEVIDSLPLLQSYGLNYFEPLSQYSGLKPYVATIPFVYQFGGELYTEDGMQAGINSSETIMGMQLMSELYTHYNLPKYVGNFFTNFRYGTIPIGISDLSTYILLQSAAPELDGLWDVALHPGVYDAKLDAIKPYASVGAQSNMILSQTNKQDEAWQFLQWWMSTETQSKFAFTIMSTYGKEYFWNTANLEAFATIPMSNHVKETILAQWAYAIEAPRIPGSYMVEREISNAWTSIVFEGENPKRALDEAVRVANREITYKMGEFGYTLNGVPVKNYKVPTMDNIDYWLKEVSR
jgi:ABC-type glycerol-3-phosphate transport system substrate-binding protein